MEKEEKETGTIKFEEPCLLQFRDDNLTDKPLPDAPTPSSARSAETAVKAVSVSESSLGTEAHYYVEVIAEAVRDSIFELAKQIDPALTEEVFHREFIRMSYLEFKSNPRIEEVIKDIPGFR